MKKYLFVLMSAVLMVMSAGCSKDEEEVVLDVNPSELSGIWWVSHQYHDSELINSCDTWEFAFYKNGTGSSDRCTHIFTYELKNGHVFLHYQSRDNYNSQLDFEYIIKSCSKDIMEWDEISGNSNALQYLTFHHTVDTLIGYWESVKNSATILEGKGGYHFLPNGDVNAWEITKDGKYSEQYWGFSWQNTMEFDRNYSKFENTTGNDGKYNITDLTEERFMLHASNKDGGISDLEYIKLPGRPDIPEAY